ncbi:hypothetical protein RhiirB3_454017 [Rhizophagus irregularis]|uniref:Uncharacterized protein n=1 Tax=Rhizophagus irregularis TaxID=588596 RepID=A0A2I1FJ06_9GLOM|nr:hypothetical protein RhiirC2_787728 [Rhizophagus irregularis]PKY34372.1 hypothetical protein RhiirB3_454017 [Rhizophagus irregularis]
MSDRRKTKKYIDLDKYQYYDVTISSIDSEEIDDRIIYMDEIEKRKEGIWNMWRM